VYDFVSDARNLPRWATAFVRSVRPANGAWIIDTPLGEMGFRFVERNAFGVLDHVVTLASGEVTLNPMRVLPNDDGSEVIFTLFQAPDMSDLQFVEDVSSVEGDLRTLKKLLEA
jgi:hypothetical protein